MGQQWHYSKSGKQLGPVSDAELRQLANQGTLLPTDLVWREGMQEWKRADFIKGLFPEPVAAKQPSGPPPLPVNAPIQNRKKASKPLLILGIAGGGFLFLMFLCCGVLGLAVNDTQQNKQTAEAKPEDIITISSSQLFAEYKANDINADRKYKGKILQVSGTAEHISRDIVDNIYVTLKGGQYEIFSIQCFFSDQFEDQAAQLRPHQYLTIRGRCDGKFGNVMIKDCIIVQ
jgi:hypothetical protein